MSAMQRILLKVLNLLVYKIIRNLACILASMLYMPDVRRQTFKVLTGNFNMSFCLPLITKELKVRKLSIQLNKQPVRQSYSVGSPRSDKNKMRHFVGLFWWKGKCLQTIHVSPNILDLDNRLLQTEKRIEKDAMSQKWKNDFN